MIPAASPVGGFQAAVAAVTGWVTEEMLLPGRPGVVAVLEAAPRLAPFNADGRPCPVRLATMVGEAHERRMGRHAFQCLLVQAWRRGGVDLELLAGSRARVVAWFRYADFADVTLPWLRGWCGLRLLPSRPLILWRGGRGTPAEVANSNMSWTLSRPVAAHFAVSVVRSPAHARRSCSGGGPCAGRRWPTSARGNGRS